MTDYLRGTLPGLADTEEPTSVQGRYVSPEQMWEATRLVAQADITAMEQEEPAGSPIVLGHALGYDAGTYDAGTYEAAYRTYMENLRQSMMIWQGRTYATVERVTGTGETICRGY